MSEYASADDLLAVGTDEDDYVFPDGKKVRIRALPRGIVHLIADPNTSVAKAEQLGICHGLVQPSLTMTQVGPWMERVGSGYVQGLVEAIQRLSGVQEGASKEAFQAPPD